MSHHAGSARSITIIATVVAGLINVHGPARAQEAPASSKPGDAAVHLFQSLPTSNAPFDAPGATAGRGIAVEKTQLVAHPPSGSSYELLPDGFRRVHRLESQPLTRDEIAQMIADGKGDQIRGDRLEFATFTDYLPANWMQGFDNLPPGTRVDSFGNPIVNDAFGLAGWAQRDVDGLRQEIANWLLHMDNLDLAIDGRADEIAEIPPRARPESYQWSADELRAQRAETEMIIGNYFGQSVVRNIDVSDLLPLNDTRMSGGVVDSLAQYLHYYEGVKMEHASRRGEAPPQAGYPSSIADLLARHGYSMKDLLTVEPGDEGGIAGANSCYTAEDFALGWSATVNGIGIWHGSSYVDDAAADIPIGFYAYYDPCNDGSSNTLVRVSSNGYICFFQQGWGTGLGTTYQNTSIPSVIDPDGFAAPWWDDLTVSNQGLVDEVVYKIEGEVGDRVLTVEYWSVSRFGGSVSDSHFFQVKLYEQDSSVGFDYGAFTADPGNENATVGIENFAGTFGDCGPSCSEVISVQPLVRYRFWNIVMPNDECGSATCLSDGDVVAGHTFGAGGVGEACIVGNDFADVWYWYHAPASGTLTVNTCTNVGFDTVLSVHTSLCGVPIACNDDACPDGASSITTPISGGQRYGIRVAGFNGQRGLFTLSLDSTAVAPQGDTCADPLPISIPGTGTAHTLADNTGCEISCYGGMDEWLSWTAPASGVMMATTCIGSTGYLDTTLTVYSGACGSLTEIACNDDMGFNCSNPWTSRVMWVADAGVTYRYRVAGFSGQYGLYDLALNLSNCPADIAPNPQGDNSVNVNDLLAIINNWGSCVNCRQDFVPSGGNNQVNVDDLLGVINSWGQCP